MAWIYLAGLEDSASPWSPGCGQSPTVKTTDTPKLYYFQGRPTEPYLLHPSGTTSELWVPITCPVPSILSMEASLARTSALRVAALVWLGSVRACSYTWRVLRKKSALLSSFWKTSRRYAQGDLVWSASSWPLWGTISDGRLSQPPRLAPRISVSAGSASPRTKHTWPTPQAHDAKSGNPERVGRFGTKHGGRNLNDEVLLWPTPTVHGNHNAPKKGTNRGTGLSTAVKHWPTPTASMETMSDMEQARFSHSSGKRPSFKGRSGGQLNPQWVEWLMGYPIGWTELEGWATQWFRSKPVKRSKG